MPEFLTLVPELTLNTEILEVTCYVTLKGIYEIQDTNEMFYMRLTFLFG